MHQFVLEANKISEPSTILLSTIEEYPKILEATFGLTIKQKIQQSTQANYGQGKEKYSEKKTVATQKTQNQQNDSCLTQIKCPNCAKWKKWASQQEQMHLQLEKEIISKEQKLHEVMSSFKKQITQRIHRTQYLQLALQEKIKQIQTLQQTLALNIQKIQEIQRKQKIWETPQKQNKDKILIEKPIPQNKIQPISLKDIFNTEKTYNLTKDSAFTTRAQGWQCPQTLKKKNVQKVLNFGNNFQLQRFIFENQALKDYNAVLIERLKASKYKCRGVIC